MVVSRVEIACARYACNAIYLRCCAASPLVAAVGYEDFCEHISCPFICLRELAQDETADDSEVLKGDGEADWLITETFIA